MYSAKKDQKVLIKKVSFPELITEGKFYEKLSMHIILLFFLGTNMCIPLAPADGTATVRVKTNFIWDVSNVSEKKTKFF